jgi:hypothetical protein
LAFVEAARPGAVFMPRRFRYPVARGAMGMLSGAIEDFSPRASFVAWPRRPDGKLIYPNIRDEELRDTEELRDSKKPCFLMKMSLFDF